jgi:hypothetical protein
MVSIKVWPYSISPLNVEQKNYLHILNSFLTLTLKNSQEYALKIVAKIERVEKIRYLSL